MFLRGEYYKFLKIFFLDKGRIKGENLFWYI